MLDVRGLVAGYGGARVLQGIDLSVGQGEVLCLVGRNGAGKTTALRAIMGLTPPMAGEVRLGGTVISGLSAHRIPGLGIGYVPQGRRLFAGLTVAENLAVALGAPRAKGRATGRALPRALELFPRLAERMGQRAETLSGGEQQMLAMARALCLEPRVILLDEPTEGLQPSMIRTIRDVTLRLRDEGVAVLLVEQRPDAILACADRVAFIENGRNLETLPGEELRREPALLEARLGV
jgi:branched-chain amino acid transport system ATP-binding protein